MGARDVIHKQHDGLAITWPVMDTLGPWGRSVPWVLVDSVPGHGNGMDSHMAGTHVCSVPLTFTGKNVFKGERIETFKPAAGECGILLGTRPVHLQISNPRGQSWYCPSELGPRGLVERQQALGSCSVNQIPQTAHDIALGPRGRARQLCPPHPPAPGGCTHLSSTQRGCGLARSRSRLPRGEPLAGAGPEDLSLAPGGTQ